MRISFKSILTLWVLLIVALSALFYAAYSKLNPQSLVKLLNQQIEKNYPGSEVKVEDLKYKFAIDFTLELKNLRVKRGQDKIAEAGLVEIKIPWWLLVFNKGSVLITLSDLNLYVAKNVPQDLNDKKSPQNSLVSFSLPGYLSDASYSLRVQQVAVKELGGDRNFFTLSKFLIRDFQYGKNSAFEINVPISITTNGKKYSSELWLFGDVTPNVGDWILNYRGEFKTRDSVESFHFDDLVIDGNAKFNTSNFDISSQLALLIDKKEVGQGSLNSHLEKMELSMKFSQMPIGYLLLAGNPIKNPYWEKMEGSGTGELTFTHFADKENYFTLAGKVNFPGDFKFSDNFKIPGKWLIKFENSNWETSFISNSGEVNFFRRAALDFNSGKIKQYSQEIGLNGLNLENIPLPVDKIGPYLANESMIFHSSYLVLKKCKQAGSLVDGSFLYGKNPDQKFYQADLVNGSGKMMVKFLSKEMSPNDLEISASSFPWKNYDFLSPFVNLEDGVVNGNLRGQWNENFLNGNWSAKITINNLKNISGSLHNILNHLNQSFELDTSNVSSLSFEGSYSKELLKIKSYYLDANNPAFISGNLYLNEQNKSLLTLSNTKNKLSKSLKKEVPNFIFSGRTDE